jgi:hypothetical protein
MLGAVEMQENHRKFRAPSITSTQRHIAAC